MKLIALTALCIYLFLPFVFAKSVSSNSPTLLFASFYADLTALSRSSYSTMPLERAVRSAKKSIKNQLSVNLQTHSNEQEKKEEGKVLEKKEVTKENSDEKEKKKKEEEEKQKKKKEKEDKEKQEKEKKKKEKEKDKKDKDDDDKKSKDKDEKDKEEEPWFIGTLLAQYGYTVDPGDTEFVSTLVFSKAYGIYDSKGKVAQNLDADFYNMMIGVESGIVKNVDVTLNTGIVWAHGPKRRDVLYLMDTQIYLSLQLLRDRKGTRIPDLRVMIGENFPTGKFERLNPSLFGADASGTGSFATIFLLVWQKIYYTRCNYPYKWNLNLSTIVASSVDTSSSSVYIGIPDIESTVLPGNKYSANLSYEYKFGKHWGWGVDIHYDHQESSTITARSGPDFFITTPTNDSFTLVPEIEYDFSEELALMAGCWFSLWGRNSTAFFNGFFSLSYIF